MKPAPETFRLALDAGEPYEVRIDVARVAAFPNDGRFRPVRLDQNRPPTKEHWPLWFGWIQTVYQYLADKARKDIVACILSPRGSPITIVFEPKNLEPSPSQPPTQP